MRGHRMGGKCLHPATLLIPALTTHTPHHTTPRHRHNKLLLVHKVTRASHCSLELVCLSEARYGATLAVWVPNLASLARCFGMEHLPTMWVTKV